MSHRLLSWSRENFQSRLDRAKTAMTQILSREKSMLIDVARPSKTPHTYTDKFLLAEQVTNTAISSIWAVLLSLGMQPDLLAHLARAAQDGESITLEIEEHQHCRLMKKTTREIHSILASSGPEGGLGEAVLGKTVIKTVEKVLEYHFEVTAHWILRAYQGVGDHERTSQELNPRNKSFTISEHSTCESIVRRDESSPFPESSSQKLPVVIDLLLKHVDIASLMSSREKISWPQACFLIDRNHKDCHTPRRNAEIEEIMKACLALCQWSCNLSHTISYQMETIMELFQHQVFDGKDYEALQSTFKSHCSAFENFMERKKVIFIPVVPWFQQHWILNSKEVSIAFKSGNYSIMEESAVTALLDEFVIQLNDLFTDVNKLFSSSPHLPQVATSAGLSVMAIISEEKLRLLIGLIYLQAITEQHRDCVQYLENMIHRQLVVAIGKELTSRDFDSYMNHFHYHKFFRNDYKPIAFSHSVRRNDLQSSEGSIEIVHPEALERDAIMTFQSSLKQPEDFGMEFTINASTTIRFKGQRHIHGYITHRFLAESLGEEKASLNLVVEAKQFSSFIVLLGRISSDKVFDAKHAFILQNKDLYTIPLLLETLPTPKAFREAVESLSPEQHRFAKAIRGMQLESTLFGIVVIQIKPQLERVLDLPPNTLNKEIALTQDLMKLFIDFQISPDLLAFDIQEDKDETVDGIDRELAQVRRNVKRITDMIEESKQEELAEKRRGAALTAKPIPPPISQPVILPDCQICRSHKFYCLGLLTMSFDESPAFLLHCTQSSRIPKEVIYFVLQQKRVVDMIMNHWPLSTTMVSGMVSWHFMRGVDGLLYMAITEARYPRDKVETALRALEGQCNGKFVVHIDTQEFGLQIQCQSMLQSICTTYDEMNVDFTTIAAAKSLEEYHAIQERVFSLENRIDRELQSHYEISTDLIAEELQLLTEKLQLPAVSFKKQAGEVKKKSIFRSFNKMVKRTFGSFGGSTTASNPSHLVMCSTSIDPRGSNEDVRNFVSSCRTTSSSRKMFSRDFEFESRGSASFVDDMENVEDFKTIKNEVVKDMNTVRGALVVETGASATASGEQTDPSNKAAEETIAEQNMNNKEVVLQKPLETAETSSPHVLSDCTKFCPRCWMKPMTSWTRHNP